MTKQPRKLVLVNITDVGDLTKLEEFLSFGYCFRGQADAGWRLSTAIERLKVRDKRAFEKATLMEFRQKIYLIEPNFPRDATNGDCLHYMQHHGCPTRCLDVTKSFYVALFMAACDLNQNKKKFSVWAIDYCRPYRKTRFGEAGDNLLTEEERNNKDIDASLEADPPLDQAARMVLLIQPCFTSPRMLNQQALYLFPRRLGDSLATCLETHFEVNLRKCETVSIKKLVALIRRNEIPPVVKIEICSELRETILCQLDRMNVNWYQLLGGVDGFVKGLSKHAWQTPIPQFLHTRRG